MAKCPLNNFSDCTSDCAWHLSEPKCCSLKRLANLHPVSNLIELKSIERNISSIEDILNQRMKSK